MAHQDTPGRRDGRPPLRIGDAERQRMIDILQEHVSAGRLDMAEFERRVEHATGAVFDRDLDGLLDDLPPVDGGEPTVGPPGGDRRSGRASRGARRATPGPWPAGPRGRGFPPWMRGTGVPGPLLVLAGIALVVLTHGWILFPLLFLAVMTGRGPCGPRRHRGHHRHDTTGAPWSHRGDRPEWTAWWDDDEDDAEAAWDEPGPAAPSWPGRYDPDRDADDRTV